MAYDFTTDIKYLTGDASLDSSIITWALNEAKTFYIADAASEYDDTISDVDNRLVAILAAGFIIANKNNDINPVDGTDIGLFKLDEFTVDRSTSERTLNIRKNPSADLFGMFFSWLFKYLDRGVILQYVDNGTSIVVSTYDPTLYEVDRTNPAGL